MVVMALSLVAEKVSPRVAGVLAGYPLGLAMALFFYGVESGPMFAAESAVYAMVGLVATLTFVYAYCQISLRLRAANAATASLGALAAYLTVVGGMRFLSVTRLSGVLVPFAAVFLFRFLFRRVPNVTIACNINLTFSVVAIRAASAAAIILLITGVAQMVGTRWAGLFSAFPITFYPLMLIIHLTYGRDAMQTIAKNLPDGLVSVIVYALTVSLVYPRIGVGFGTIVAFAIATAYLGLYGWWAQRKA
jgi:hypothetical protein